MHPINLTLTIPSFLINSTQFVMVFLQMHPAWTLIIPTGLETCTADWWFNDFFSLNCMSLSRPAHNKVIQTSWDEEDCNCSRKMLLKKSGLVIFDSTKIENYVSQNTGDDRNVPLFGELWKNRELVEVCMPQSITSTVRTLIPTVTTVRNPVTQFAHMDADIQVQAAMFVDRTLVYSVVWA